MSAFGGLILTNRGRNLQAKAQAGAELKYTRIGLGDGNLGSSAIVDLNRLKNEVKSLQINKLKVLTEGRVLIGTVLNNQDLTSGFYFRELGIFALDPDVGEILYCYGNSGSLAEYIPAGGGPDVIEKDIDIQTLVGSTKNVSAVINNSLIYVTQTELMDALENIEVPVTSVNQKTGAVVLSAADVGAETPAGAQSKVNALAGDGNTKTVKQLDNELGSHKAEMTNLIKIKPNITILATGWIDVTANSGFWIYEIEDTDITADTVVDVNIHLADLEKAESLKGANLSSAGKVTLYADDKPTDNIICDLKLIRQVS